MRVSFNEFTDTHLRGLLVTLCLYAQKSTQQEKVDFQLLVDLWQTARCAENLPRDQGGIGQQDLRLDTCGFSTHACRLPRRTPAPTPTTVCNPTLPYPFHPGRHPHTCPTRRSARLSVGSIFVPTPMSPPGTAYCSSFVSARRLTMRERMGVHVIFPESSFETIPGRTSIS